MPTDDPVTAPPAPAAPRWMRVALVVSLALNLLVAGVLIGMALRGTPPGGPSRDIAIGPFAAAFAPEDREALRRAFIARSLGEGGRRERREDMRALLGALRAEPFDAEAAHDVFLRLSARMKGRLDTGFALIEERIAAMPGAERQAFADRLEQEFRRPRRAGGGDAAP